MMKRKQDISLRKCTKREIDETESRYRSLVESALVGVYLFHDNHLTYVNPYIENLLGYSAEELSVIDVNLLIFPEDLHLIPKPPIKETKSDHTQ